MSTWRVVGDTGLLVELDGLDAVHRAARAVAAVRVDGVVDVVPAARTLLVCLDPASTTPEQVAAALRPVVAATEAGAAGAAALCEGAGDEGAGDEGAPTPAEVLRVPVTYDGRDIPVVARHVGCRADEVAQWHASTPWRVAFAGFAPGFFYLAGPGDLDVPRHATPRQRVPAGAVGVAGSFSGIYPRSSPGGWQLIGRTALSLWDVDTTPPTPLRPGMRVVFEAVS